MKRINEKKDIMDYILYTIMLFPIVTLLTKIPIIGSYLNKVLIVLLFIELIYSCKYFKYKIFDFFIIFLTTILNIIALIYTGKFRYDNINSLFYLEIWVILYILFFTQSKKIQNSFIKNKDFIKWVIYIWNIIVGISIFIPSSYIGIEKGFASFAGTSFRLAPTVLMITALTIFLFYLTKNKNINIFLFIIPTYSIVMGASRTYFGVYMLIMLAYILTILKRKIYLIIMVILLSGVMTIIIPNTGIGRKLKLTEYNSNSYYDFWGTVTSGRTIFWKWDIDAYKEFGLAKKILGNGFNYVYDVNYKHGGVAIWAHNDFINLLLNYGILGVFVYLYSFYKMYKFYFKDKKLKCIRKLVIIAIFINSFFNMSYTYLCATLSYPIFGFVFSYYSQLKIKEEENVQ